MAHAEGKLGHQPAKKQVGICKADVANPVHDDCDAAPSPTVSAHRGTSDAVLDRAELSPA